MMMKVVSGVSSKGRMCRRGGVVGGVYTSLPNMVISMDMTKTEMGGRRAGTEERDTKWAAVFNTHLRIHIGPI